MFEFKIQTDKCAMVCDWENISDLYKICVPLFGFPLPICF